MGHRAAPLVWWGDGESSVFIVALADGQAVGRGFWSHSPSALPYFLNTVRASSWARSSADGRWSSWPLKYPSAWARITMSMAGWSAMSHFSVISVVTHQGVAL